MDETSSWSYTDKSLKGTLRKDLITFIATLKIIIPERNIFWMSLTLLC